MQRDHNEFKVGLTVAVVDVLVMAIVIFVGKWDVLFLRTRPLEVRFDHTHGIEGLRTDDPVRIGGVNVGRVREIRHEKDKKTGKLYVHVLCDIPERYDLYSDARITVVAKPLGEGGTLDVLDIGRKGRMLGEADVIDGLPPVGLGAVMRKLAREFEASDPTSLLGRIKHQLDPTGPTSLITKLHRSMDDLNAISAGIRRETNAEQEATILAKMHRIMNNLNSLTASLKGEFDREDKHAALARVYTALDNLNSSLTAARKMLDNADPKIDSMLTHVQATAQRLDEDISRPVADELDRTKDGSLLARIHTSVAAAQAGMTNLKELTNTGREIVVINRANLQLTVDNFVQTSSHLKAVAKELRRSPWRLLHKPDRPEREYANLMSSARAFSDAASALDQANSKLTQILKLGPKRVAGDDPQLIQIREQIKQAFCQFEQAQEKLWKLLKLKK